MTRKFLFIACLAGLIACNNDKDKEKENTTPDEGGNAKTYKVNSGDSGTNTNTSHYDNEGTVTSPLDKRNQKCVYVVEGEKKEASITALVTKDKDKLSQGNDYFALTTIEAGNGESMNVNFVFALKPGEYPVVGLSYQRGPSDKGELYGGLLGGKPKLTGYKIKLTEVKDLGANNAGGHKWSISGSVEGPMKIGAMKMMLMDKTRNPPHPESITVSNLQFTNVAFEDNFEELMEKGLKKLKKETP